MAICKAFLDTNVILDMLLNRAGMASARTILCTLSKSQCVISVASFYTIAFYVEKYLKREGIMGKEKMNKLRTILNSLLDLVTVVGVEEHRLKMGLNDDAFTDVEDSFQLQTALSTDCRVLVTSNTKDFKNTSALPVITPEEFVAQYLIK